MTIPYKQKIANSVSTKLWRAKHMDIRADSLEHEARQLHDPSEPGDWNKLPEKLQHEAVVLRAKAAVLRAQAECSIVIHGITEIPDSVGLTR